MGFTDRLLAAPISRFAMVLGRLAGTAALGALTAIWFIAIGILFGARIAEGVPGALLDHCPGNALCGRIWEHRSRCRPAEWSCIGGPGLVPTRVRDPLPLHRVFPRRSAPPAGSLNRGVEPTQLHRRGIRDPVVSTLTSADLAKGLAAGAPRPDRVRAQRRRPALPTSEERMSIGAQLATVAALTRRALNEILRVPGAAIPGVLAPTIFFLGLTAVFGEPDAAPRVHDRQLSELPGAGQPHAGRRVCRAAAGSTWHGTSNRVGSIACWPPLHRARCLLAGFVISASLGLCSRPPCCWSSPSR